MIEADNADALTFLRMAGANGTEDPASALLADTATASAAVPDSFADGRYRVVRFLGEGGKKRVFLAHDARLDRDVAFALIKTDGLDEAGRERVTRATVHGEVGSVACCNANLRTAHNCVRFSRAPTRTRTALSDVGFSVACSTN